MGGQSELTLSRTSTSQQRSSAHGAQGHVQTNHCPLSMGSRGALSVTGPVEAVYEGFRVFYTAFTRMCHNGGIDRELLLTMTPEYTVTDVAECLAGVQCL